MRRMHANKRKSAKSFRKRTSRTKRINVMPGLARGGIRL